MSDGIGFIGAGNMGGALFRGIAQAFPDRAMTVFDLESGKAAGLAASTKGRKRTAPRTAAGSAQEVLEQSSVVFMAVKPQVYEGALRGLAGALKPGTVLVCMAPGWPIARIKEAAPKGARIVRIMPNIQAQVLASVVAVCPADDVPADSVDAVLALLASVGRAELIDEKLFNAVTGLSGSGGAYVFMFIEAMADAAVLNGMPRNKAYIFAAQTVLGAAKMVLDSGEHPGVLKDRVCSPAGTTIEGVRTLEARGFRSAVIEAVTAGTAKAIAMEPKPAVPKKQGA